MYTYYNICVGYRFDYSEEKNFILKSTRKIGFQDIIEAIGKGGLLDNIKHFNEEKYPNQKIFIVKIKGNIYAVPYVIDNVKRRYFLKTIYPGTKLKKKYTK